MNPSCSLRNFTAFRVTFGARFLGFKSALLVATILSGNSANGRCGESEDRCAPATIPLEVSYLGPRSSYLAARHGLSQRGVEAIIEFETSSENYYDSHLRRPSVPGADSGITIGIGYDLGYHTSEEIRRDWSPYLSNSSVNALAKVAGLTRSRARSALPRVRHIEISLAKAKQVFYRRSLPGAVAMTKAAFPGVEALPPDAQAALVSLVMNRGVSTSGVRRHEMRNIATILRSKRDVQWKLEAITVQIKTMKRLWSARSLGGLHQRRDGEAALVSLSREDMPVFEPDVSRPASPAPPATVASAAWSFASSYVPVSYPAPAAPRAAPDPPAPVAVTKLPGFGNTLFASTALSRDSSTATVTAAVSRPSANMQKPKPPVKVSQDTKEQKGLKFSRRDRKLLGRQ